MDLAQLQASAPARLQRGFSLIEVLVTLLIISLALLGTAGLQAYSMRLNQRSQFRSLAVVLAADLAERMEANKPGSVAGSYAQTTKTVAGPLSTACVAAVCDGQNLAAADLVQWENAVVTALPQASWTVVQTSAGNPSTYSITISWVDRRIDTPPAAFDAVAQTGSNAAGAGERLFYTATRTILN